MEVMAESGGDEVENSPGRLLSILERVYMFIPPFYRSASFKKRSYPGVSKNNCPLNRECKLASKTIIEESAVLKNISANQRKESLSR